MNKNRPINLLKFYLVSSMQIIFYSVRLFVNTQIKKIVFLI